MDNPDLGFGYDIGYRNGLLWRRLPAKHVVKACETVKSPALCLDLGCGEGKNAVFVASLGIDVVAVDGSQFALQNARKFSGEIRNIEWLHCEANAFLKQDIRSYELIICTGIAHCVSNASILADLLMLCSRKIKPAGFFVFSSFNERRQDLSGHEKDFSPLLLPHLQLLVMIAQAGLSVVDSSDDDIDDLHPHIGIRHVHSITRALCTK